MSFAESPGKTDDFSRSSSFQVSWKCCGCRLGDPGVTTASTLKKVKSVWGSLEEQRGLP